MQKKKIPGPAATGSRASHALHDFYFPEIRAEEEHKFYWVHVGPTGKERRLSRKPRRTKATPVTALRNIEYAATRYIRPLIPENSDRIPVRPRGQGWTFLGEDEEYRAIWWRDRERGAT